MKVIINKVEKLENGDEIKTVLTELSELNCQTSNDALPVVKGIMDIRRHMMAADGKSSDVENGVELVFPHKVEKPISVIEGVII